MSTTGSFEDIYAEYKSVAARTRIVAQIVRPGQPYHVNIIHPEDLVRQKELARILIDKFSDKLTDPAELFEIADEAEEHCVCKHRIWIHGFLLPPTDTSPRFIHDGPCLVQGCGCQKYKMQAE